MSSRKTSEDEKSRRPPLPLRPNTIAAQGTSSPGTPRKQTKRMSSTSEKSTSPNKAQSATLKSSFTRPTSSPSVTQSLTSVLLPKTTITPRDTQTKSLTARKPAVTQTPVQSASKKRLSRIPHSPTTPKEEVKWRQNRCNYFCRLLRKGWTIKNAAEECNKAFGHIQPAKDRHTRTIKFR